MDRWDLNVETLNPVYQSFEKTQKTLFANGLEFFNFQGLIFRKNTLNKFLTTKNHNVNRILKTIDGAELHGGAFKSFFLQLETLLDVILAYLFLHTFSSKKLLTRMSF